MRGIVMAGVPIGHRVESIPVLLTRSGDSQRAEGYRITQGVRKGPAIRVVQSQIVAKLMHNDLCCLIGVIHPVCPVDIRSRGGERALRGVQIKARKFGQPCPAASEIWHHNGYAVVSLDGHNRLSDYIYRVLLQVIECYV